MAGGPVVDGGDAIECTNSKPDLRRLQAAARSCRSVTVSILERIQAEIDGHAIVLFMKGTPQYPMCGFSSRTVAALHEAGARDYRAINVLEAPEVRANLPRFSNWPTFPQLFIHGELIGGCDIALELHESGELSRMVAEGAAS